MLKYNLIVPELQGIVQKEFLVKYPPWPLRIHSIRESGKVKVDRWLSVDYKSIDICRSLVLKNKDRDG